MNASLVFLSSSMGHVPPFIPGWFSYPLIALFNSLARRDFFRAAAFLWMVFLAATLSSRL